jgi:hypothetical protein
VAPPQAAQRRAVADVLIENLHRAAELAQTQAEVQLASTQDALGEAADALELGALDGQPPGLERGDGVI